MKTLHVPVLEMIIKLSVLQLVMYVMANCQDESLKI